MKIFQVVKMMFFVLLIWTEAIYAGTYYVDVNGDNSNGDGSERQPWRTVGYAVGHVHSGDTVSINDGIYSEFQIVLPEGVSLTSTSKDPNKVIIQPAKSMQILINLKSYGVNRDGNQEISFLQLNGTSGRHHAQIGVDAKDRNNLRIHHNSIYDFDTGGRFCFGIRVRSSGTPPGAVWPEDVGLLGDDSALDQIWPANPVTNLEIDNNTIINCGRDDDSTIPYGGLWLYNIKDSSIHDNEIDNTNNYGQCMFATPAFLNNVDIYDNTLRMATLSLRSSYIIEFWYFRGGCEIYGNDADTGFSLPVGKETKVYNNIINVPDPHVRRGYGLEFSNQSFGEMYDNYIGGASLGILAGDQGNQPSKNFITRGTIIRGNTIVNPKQSGIRLMSNGTGERLVKDFKIYNNTLDGGVDANYPALFLHQDRAGVMTNIEVKNNIIVNSANIPGQTRGTVGNLEIYNNLFWNNPNNYWSGGGDVSTIIADPKFIGSSDYYYLQFDSPARDAGVDVGLPYKGSAPDIGAVEYGQTEGIKPPENVMASSSPS